MRHRLSNGCESPSAAEASQVSKSAGFTSGSTDLKPIVNNINATADMVMTPTENTVKRSLRQRLNSGSSNMSVSNSSLLDYNPLRSPPPKRPRKPLKVIPICGLCLGTPKENRSTGIPEDLIGCWDCGQSGHPSCLKMPTELVERIRTLRWQCVDCKRCCLCRSQDNAKVSDSSGSDLLLCDSCDRGFHMSCVDPQMSELPEGTWICPVCTPRSGQNPPNPLIEAIDLCDRLSQYEIDWMHQALNHPEPKSPDPEQLGQKGSKVTSSPPSSLTVGQRQPKNKSTPKSHSVKVSKRLIQKSIASWTVPKGRPKKTTSYLPTVDNETGGQGADFLPASRPRRSVSRKLGNLEKRNSSLTLRTHTTPKRLTFTGSRLLSEPRQSSLRAVEKFRSQQWPSFSSPEQGDQFELGEVSSSSVPPLTAVSKPLAPTFRRPRGHRRTSIIRPKHRSTALATSTRGRSGSAAWRSFRSRHSGPSRSTLQRWSAAGVNIQRALQTFTQRGRVRLSSVKGPANRHSRSSSLVPSSDEDDDSSVTLAAADLDMKVCDSGLDVFDPNNDECPELAVINDDCRTLFADIQSDVQACLPQPLESSLALPPANNPKVLNMKDTSQLTGDCVTTDPKEVKLEEEPRNPPRIQLGRHIITTWYSAPYPSEYARLNLLYVCEFCLKYSKTRKVYMRHIRKCPFSFPPGNEIYRCGSISVFEVDGYTSRLYCQQLCLLAKLFLDHKTLYYDVEPFLFYVVAIREDDCYHLVGYFSKEKRSAQKFNLSCIMVLPPYQNMAFGRFLIDFSFLLSRIEGQPGSPEKPLSDLGRISYESYWRSKVLPFILNELDNAPSDEAPSVIPDSISVNKCVFTIHQITKATGIDPHDVAETIEQLASSIDLGPDKRPVITFDRTELVKLKEKYDTRSKNWITVDEECLRWSPLTQSSELDGSTEATVQVARPSMSCEKKQKAPTLASQRKSLPSLSPAIPNGPDFNTKHDPKGQSPPMNSVPLRTRRSSLRSHVGPVNDQCISTSSVTDDILSPLVDPPNVHSSTPNEADKHRRYRRSIKRHLHSSCKKEPVVSNQSKPPDPPSPSGASNHQTRGGGPSSASNRSTRAAYHLRNSSGSIGPADGGAGDQSSNLQTQRVNSSLPETEELSPLRPSLSSSPRSLTTKLLDAPLLCPNFRPVSPPALSPPPPILSTDAEGLVGCCLTSNHHGLSTQESAAPPSLSFYDSVNHSSLSPKIMDLKFPPSISLSNSTAYMPDTASVPKHSSSRIPSSRKQLHLPSTSSSSLKSSLTSPCTVVNRFLLDIPDVASCSLSPVNLDEQVGRLPRRSASTSMLVDQSMKEDRLPVVTRHSPSPPILPPSECTSGLPLFLHPILRPSTRSPSPPLLTTVMPEGNEDFVSSRQHLSSGQLAVETVDSKQQPTSAPDDQNSDALSESTLPMYQSVPDVTETDWSRVTSPASYQSSEATLPMRLSTPSPPVLASSLELSDAGELVGSIDPSVSSHRLRRSSEPPNGRCRISTVNEELSPLHWKQTCLSPSYFHSDACSNVIQSQSTTNLTPESFIDDMALLSPDNLYHTSPIATHESYETTANLLSNEPTPIHTTGSQIPKISMYAVVKVGQLVLDCCTTVPELDIRCITPTVLPPVFTAQCRVKKSFLHQKDHADPLSFCTVAQWPLSVTASIPLCISTNFAVTIKDSVGWSGSHSLPTSNDLLSPSHTRSRFLSTGSSIAKSNPTKSPVRRCSDVYPETPAISTTLKPQFPELPDCASEILSHPLPVCSVGQQSASTTLRPNYIPIPSSQSAVSSVVPQFCSQSNIVSYPPFCQSFYAPAYTPTSPVRATAKTLPKQPLTPRRVRRRQRGAAPNDVSPQKSIRPKVPPLVFQQGASNNIAYNLQALPLSPTAHQPNLMNSYALPYNVCTIPSSTAVSTNQLVYLPTNTLSEPNEGFAPQSPFPNSNCTFAAPLTCPNPVTELRTPEHLEFPVPPFGMNVTGVPYPTEPSFTSMLPREPSDYTDRCRLMSSVTACSEHSFFPPQFSSAPFIQTSTTQASSSNALCVQPPLDPNCGTFISMPTNLPDPSHFTTLIGTNAQCAYPRMSVSSITGYTDPGTIGFSYPLSQQDPSPLLHPTAFDQPFVFCPSLFVCPPNDMHSLGPCSNQLRSPQLLTESDYPAYPPWQQPTSSFIPQPASLNWSVQPGCPTSQVLPQPTPLAHPMLPT